MPPIAPRVQPVASPDDRQHDDSDCETGPHRGTPLCRRDVDTASAGPKQSPEYRRRLAGDSASRSAVVSITYGPRPRDSQLGVNQVGDGNQVVWVRRHQCVDIRRGRDSCSAGRRTWCRHVTPIPAHEVGCRTNSASVSEMYNLRATRREFQVSPGVACTRRSASSPATDRNAATGTGRRRAAAARRCSRPGHRSRVLPAGGNAALDREVRREPRLRSSDS